MRTDDPGPSSFPLGQAIAAWADPARELARAALAALAAINILNAWVLLTDPADGRRSWLLADGELNPMTWFSVSATMAAALMAYVCACADAPHRQTFWLLSSAVLVLLGFDDATALHERVGGGISSRPGWHDLGHLWVIPWVLGAIAVLGVLWRARPRLPRLVKSELAVGGLLFVAAAGGLEVVAAYVSGQTHLLTTVEENLEVVGILVVVRAMWRHVIALDALE